MNTKDIEEIAQHIIDCIWIETNIKQGVYDELRVQLTKLTQHHEAEVERRVEAEREKLKKFYFLMTHGKSAELLV